MPEAARLGAGRFFSIVAAEFGWILLQRHAMVSRTPHGCLFRRSRSDCLTVRSNGDVHEPNPWLPKLIIRAPIQIGAKRGE